MKDERYWWLIGFPTNHPHGSLYNMLKQSHILPIVNISTKTNRVFNGSFVAITMTIRMTVMTRMLLRLKLLLLLPLLLLLLMMMTTTMTTGAIQITKKNSNYDN